MAIKHFIPQQTYPRIEGPLMPTLTPTTIATAAAVTYTAAQLLTGLIIRDPAGAGRTDILPTAALLLVEINGKKVGVSFEVWIRNNADAAETITLNAGAGGTLSAAGQSTTTSTITQNNSRLYRIVFTNVTLGSEAYTAYSLTSGTH